MIESRILYFINENKKLCLETLKSDVKNISSIWETKVKENKGIANPILEIYAISIESS